MVALAITVCLAQWLAGAYPGPGAAAVAGHVLAALAAVTLQVAAERLQGRMATLAAWAVVVLAVTVLWFGWWA